MATSDLTAQRLREVLHYDPETGLFTWVGKSDHRAHIRIGETAGKIDGDGYVKIYINRVPYKAHRLAWLFMYGKHPSNEIDHVNGVRHDNRLANIRDVQKVVNRQNRHALVNPKTGSLSGAHSGRSGWESRIYANGKQYFLGRFASAEEAQIAYYRMKRKLHPGWEPKVNDPAWATLLARL